LQDLKAHGISSARKQKNARWRERKGTKAHKSWEQNDPPATLPTPALQAVLIEEASGGRHRVSLLISPMKKLI
jgi:hypothetical protein